MTSLRTKRELVIYGTIVLVLMLAVHTFEYYDTVRVEKPLTTTHVLRPGIDPIPAPRCPEVYKFRALSGWIVTETRGAVIPRCYYGTPKKVWL